jgi:hypothetical protein
MRDARRPPSTGSRTVATWHVIRAVIGMAVGMTVMAMPMLVALQA